MYAWDLINDNEYKMQKMRFGSRDRVMNLGQLAKHYNAPSDPAHIEAKGRPNLLYTYFSKTVAILFYVLLYLIGSKKSFQSIIAA